MPPYPYVVSDHPIATYLPPDIGKLAQSIGARDKKVGFFQTCMEARGPPELHLLDMANHPSDPLVNHKATHGIPITIPKGMKKWGIGKIPTLMGTCFCCPRGRIFPPGAVVAYPSG